MKRSLKGEIVSTKMEKTAVVEVTSLKAHPKYLKRMRIIRRFSVHNSENKYKLGDKVVIGQTRPLSKTKRWVIKEKL